MTPEELAVLFHETYERLAPSFGYETRTETRKFDPTTPNGRLMIAVCGEISARTAPAIATASLGTPATQAAAALVAQSLKLAKALRRYEPLMDVSSLVDDDGEQSATINLHMDAVIFIGEVDRYLAATQQEQP